MEKGVQVEAWGGCALFTRPELKVERVSYDVMRLPPRAGYLRLSTGPRTEVAHRPHPRHEHHILDYYDALVRRGDITPPGWSAAKASFALDIDKQGTLHGVIPLKVLPDGGKKEVPQSIG